MTVTTNFKSPLGGKKRKSTYGELRHLEAVKGLRCIITGRYGVVAHHCFCDRQVRYAGRKAPHLDTIPLWEGIHAGLIGHDDQVAIHRNKRMWVELHGPDHGYIPAVYSEIYGRSDITHSEIEDYWNDKR